MTNKMTTEEKIDVMNAYTEGKQIQFYDFSNKTWEDVRHEPVWDWDNCLYRIKPESKYRSYKNIEEMYEDSKTRLDAIQHPMFSNLWLKQKDYEVEEMIAGIDHVNSYVLIGTNWLSLGSVFYQYNYLDGTPFGKKE